jgi:hypothetical protein
MSYTLQGLPAVAAGAGAACGQPAVLCWGTPCRTCNLVTVQYTASTQPFEPGSCACGVLHLVHRAHSIQYVETVEAMSEDYTKNIHRVGDESAFMPGGFQVAALAAGGAITATEAVLDGRVANAYVLCRCAWSKGALFSQYCRGMQRPASGCTCGHPAVVMVLATSSSWTLGAECHAGLPWVLQAAWPPCRAWQRRWLLHLQQRRLRCAGSHKPPPCQQGGNC